MYVMPFVRLNSVVSSSRTPGKLIVARAGATRSSTRRRLLSFFFSPIRCLLGCFGDQQVELVQRPLKEGGFEHLLLVLGLTLRAVFLKRHAQSGQSVSAQTIAIAPVLFVPATSNT